MTRRLAQTAVLPAHTIRKLEEATGSIQDALKCLESGSAAASRGSRIDALKSWKDAVQTLPRVPCQGESLNRFGRFCSVPLNWCDGSRSGARWRVFDGAQQCRELGRLVCFRRHDLAGALERLVGV